jgi:hypothetical protein
MKRGKYVKLLTLWIVATVPAVNLQGCKGDAVVPDTVKEAEVTVDASEKPGAPVESTPAPKNKDEVAKSVQGDVDTEVDKRVRDSRARIVEEAVSAIHETENALTALGEKKTDEALAALERATGKLELVVAREPALAFAPVDTDLITSDVYASPEAIEEARDEAADLLDDGKVQSARSLIAGLASEIVIRVTTLPLASYPAAIEAVTPLIDEGEIDKARAALRSALSTLVVDEYTIPLPVVRAEAILRSAKKLAEKKGRTDKESDDLGNLLDNARYQLKMAESLGYGESRDFQAFYDQLDKIEEKIGGGKSGTGFFGEIEKSLSDLKHSVFE